MKTKGRMLGWFFVALAVTASALFVSVAIYGRRSEILIPLVICYVQMAYSATNKVGDAATLGLSFRRQFVFYLLGLGICAVVANVIVVTAGYVGTLLSNHYWASLPALILSLLASEWTLDRLWNRWTAHLRK